MCDGFDIMTVVKASGNSDRFRDSIMGSQSADSHGIEEANEARVRTGHFRRISSPLRLTMFL